MYVLALTALCALCGCGSVRGEASRELLMKTEREEVRTVRVGDDEYRVRLALVEDFQTLDRWRQVEEHGRWRVEHKALIGEWLEKSPSLFLKKKIEGDYLWQIKTTRVRPDQAFRRRFASSTHGRGHEPERMYNFNFWLRADSPNAEDFFRMYSRKLGTGWNGMGDDYWNSLYTTIVWGPLDRSKWVRLRRSPGYKKVRDISGVLPYLPYDEPHVFTFVIRKGRARMYFDDKRVYDYEDHHLYEAGYIGLCVWHCVMRYEEMKLYDFE